MKIYELYSITVCFILKVTWNISVEWPQIDMGFSIGDREYKIIHFFMVFKFRILSVCICVIKIAFFKIAIGIFYSKFE